MAPTSETTDRGAAGDTADPAAVGGTADPAAVDSSGAGASTLALVTMLSRTVYRTTAEHDGSMGVNLKHVIALSYLRELGAVGQKYFGGVLCLDANNTVLLLNELEAGGMVIRRRDEEDRRRHVVEVTETGLDVLRGIERSMLEIEDELLAALDRDQRSQFRELLQQALYGEHGVLRRLAPGAA